MPRQVWKFEVPHASEAVPPRYWPEGAKIVHVAADPDEIIWAWALVDPDAEREDRHVAYFATGVPIPDGWEYIASVGPFENSLGYSRVWHVFERR
jgi:hypothetical protein